MLINKVVTDYDPGSSDEIRMMKKVLIIAGPTGVGKSDLAMQLAQALNGEIISCDSVQVYSKLNVGCNKPSIEDMARVPHHLVGHIDLNARYTAADFFDDCHLKIKEVLNRGKLPLLVGGSGFYLKWIFEGRPTTPDSDPAIKKEIEDSLKDDVCWETSLNRLVKLDPDYAATLCKNDYYRLVRALTINKQTGKQLASFKAKPVNIGIDFRCFYLTTERPMMYHNIDLRCFSMIRGGILEEALDLMELEATCSAAQTDLVPHCAAAGAIGYRESIAFLKKLRSGQIHDIYSEFREFFSQFQANTRQFSRRQDSLFYENQKFKWINKIPVENLARRVSELFELDEIKFESVAGDVSIDAKREKRLGHKRNHYMKFYRTTVCLSNHDIYNAMKPVCEKLGLPLNAPCKNIL